MLKDVLRNFSPRARCTYPPRPTVSTVLFDYLGRVFSIAAQRVTKTVHVQRFRLPTRLDWICTYIISYYKHHHTYIVRARMLCFGNGNETLF